MVSRRAGSPRRSSSVRGEPSAVEVAVADHHAGARPREHLGVAGLVIPGSAGERHEHGWDPDRGQLGGHPAGPAHEQRGVLVEQFHVILVADELVPQRVAGRADGREPLSALFVVASARHMVDHDVGAVAPPLVQRQGRVVDPAGAEAPAHDRDHRRRHRRSRHGGDLGPDGVAGHDRTAEGRPRQRDRGACPEPHRDAVGETGTSVGLVHHRRNAAEPCGCDRGQRRVAADTDDDGRAPASDDAPCAAEGSRPRRTGSAGSGAPRAA